MSKSKLQTVYNALHLNIDKNSIDAGEDGTLRFPNGLVLTDSSEQWNGTRYDIDSLDVSDYSKRMFADHEYGVSSIVGNMLNVYRRGSQVVTDGVRFAINENPLAKLVYDLIVGGFLDSVSIGTQGPYPQEQEDGSMVYFNHSLMEVSWVGLPNNKNATINDAQNLLDIAQTNGLDITQYNQLNSKEKSMLVKIKNSREFKVEIKYTNEAGEETTAVLEAEAELEVPEAEKEAVETQISEAVDADADADEDEEEEENTAKNGITKEDIELLKNFKSEITELRKFKEEHSADNADEPKFKNKGAKKGVTKVSTNKTPLADRITNMTGKQRIQRQAELAFRNGLYSEEFRALNEANVESLVENQEKLEQRAKTEMSKHIAQNVVTMAEDSFGGLVPCYELLSEIIGCRTSYDSLLSVFSFENSDNLQYAWNLRVGDIDMQPVELCDDGEDGNRKPISEYGLQLQTRTLEELAAVTPVCNAATLFAVGDLLQDIARGYQTDQNRKFAQLIVAELEKAVETNVTGKSTGGADIAPNADASITAETGEEWAGILTAITEVVECAPDGVLVMSTASKAVIQAAGIRAGLNNGGFVSVLEDGVALETLLGHRVVAVPNDLLPTLGTSQTRAFVINGATVTINHAIFYVQPTNWRGITHNSGLQYDLSRDAAYEINLGTPQSPNWVTRSAYQRNELVLRGSFFRGGGVKDFRLVTGVLATTDES